jgi:hypothetical protein
VSLRPVSARRAACQAAGWRSHPEARHHVRRSCVGGYPVQGDANAAVVRGALVTYDATKTTNGVLTELFHSDTNPANSLGMFAKFATPVVATAKCSLPPSVTQSSSTDCRERSP